MKLKVPKVIKDTWTSNEEVKDGFVVKHFSYSFMNAFCSNPILAKIKYINGDSYDTANSIKSIIGTAFHRACAVYYGGTDTPITSEEEGILLGLKTGMQFLEDYNDGFIKYSEKIPNKAKAQEIFAFVFNSYVKELPYKKNVEVVAIEEKIEEKISVEWRGVNLNLPIKLKGYVDKIIREDGKLKIVDYKTVSNFSKPDEIDGAKIIQAVQYYFLVYAKYGEEPYSFIYEEVKTTPNRDKTVKQVLPIEIVYSKSDLFFDFYLRLYQDIVLALQGQMVYLPNLFSIFREDSELGIISYIHRLDEREEVAKLMKKHEVETLTDLLKKQIQNSGNLRKMMKTIEESFVEAKNIDYSKMKTEEKIQTKLMEHGLSLSFEGKVEGASIDLYQYTPSIGIKMSKIANYVEDIEQVLGVSGVRILAPIPFSTFVGFEIPKKDRTFPALSVKDSNIKNIKIGQDAYGNSRNIPLTEAPHLLVAGSSGSGKSVFLNSLIEQLSKDKKVLLHLFDPKMVELIKFKRNSEVYATAIMDIWSYLQDLHTEMKKRYEILSKKGLKDISETDLNYIVVIFDEFGDIIMQNFIHTEWIKTGKVFQKGPRAGEEEEKKKETNVSKEIEKLILLLAQMGRSAGIHLVLATQRPSTDVITGTIKANFPTKVLFRTAKAIDSQVVIDEKGGEKLLGKGDMLFAGDKGIERLQGYLTK